jgi:hypothetical protein
MTRKVVEDWAGGMDGLEARRGGDVGFAFRERVGLADVRGGEAGAGVFDFVGSSTMYMGVSRSRNSTQH